MKGDSLMNGLVLWFRSSYGFIKPDHSNEELFFHWTDIESDDNFKNVYGGDRVVFEVVEDRKIKNKVRLRAAKVVVVERISSLGKPLLRVSFIERSSNININYLNVYITAKAKIGLKHINITDKKVIATDYPLVCEEIEELSKILNSGYTGKKILYTGEAFKYDLNLV
jgi:cold shock CspA family protein